MLYNVVCIKLKNFRMIHSNNFYYVRKAAKFVCHALCMAPVNHKVSGRRMIDMHVAIIKHSYKRVRPDDPGCLRDKFFHK